MRRWRVDPVAFVRENFHVEPDAWQLRVLRSAARSVKSAVRIAMKASKGVGKSAVLAWLMWWFFTTRLHPKIIATSITADNLKDGLWTELASWQQKSPLLAAIATWSAERIVSNDHPETWWMSARTWPKGADASQQANTLAGIHADNVMFVLDESGGIPDAVMAAAEAGLANASPANGREAILLQAGNPTHLEGPLYRACTSEKHLWDVIEISADPDDPMRSTRVTREWALDQIAKYGRDSAYVLVNVFGKFPPGSANALLGPDDVYAAMHRKLGDRDFMDEVKILASTSRASAMTAPSSRCARAKRHGSRR